jgi:YggT family protein
MFAWVIYLINYAFDILNLLIIVRIVLSWIPHDRYNPVIRIVYDLTEPLLAPLRGRMVYGAFDFSPIVILFILGFVRNIIINLFSAF